MMMAETKCSEINYREAILKIKIKSFSVKAFDIFKFEGLNVFCGIADVVAQTNPR